MALDPILHFNQTPRTVAEVDAEYALDYALRRMGREKHHCRAAIRWRRACQKGGRIMKANGWLEEAEFCLQRWKFWKRERDAALAQLRAEQARAA